MRPSPSFLPAAAPLKFARKESSSIPSWNPAIGPTSTPSSNQSKPLSKTFLAPSAFAAHGPLPLKRSALSVGRWAFSQKWRVKNAWWMCSHAPAARANRPQGGCYKKLPINFPLRRSVLDVRCWAFSQKWRVKGAWWPSRSSKPLLVRHSPNRGRFDSYPLRAFVFPGRKEVIACRVNRFAP